MISDETNPDTGIIIIQRGMSARLRCRRSCPQINAETSVLEYWNLAQAFVRPVAERVSA